MLFSHIIALISHQLNTIQVVKEISWFCFFSRNVFCNSFLNNCLCFLSLYCVCYHFNLSQLCLCWYTRWSQLIASSRRLANFTNRCSTASYEARSCSSTQPPWDASWIGSRGILKQSITISRKPQNNGWCASSVSLRRLPSYVIPHRYSSPS